MDTMQVDKQQLIDTLTENRGNHIKAYEEAIKVYRVKAEKALRARASEIRDGKTVDPGIGLTIPENYESQYNDAITRLEWTVGDTVELSRSEFRQFILDEWGWSNLFAASTRAYQG